jgi:hypothetical protein
MNTESVLPLPNRQPIWPHRRPVPQRRCLTIGVPMRAATARFLIVSGSVTALAFGALGITGPASALPGDTSATVTVTGGSLSITVPTAAGSLGSAVNKVAGTTISGSLGEVQVNDARSAAAGSGWVASVISTAFTPTTGATIAASLVGYTAGPITKVGTATFSANDPVALTGVTAAVTATGITGDNSATWNPTITVTVPGGTLAGTYSGTITHSVT